MDVVDQTLLTPTAGCNGGITSDSAMPLDGSREVMQWADSEVLAAVGAACEDAIIGEDLYGTIRSWNGAAERMFGFSRTEATGRPISIIFSPDRLDEMHQILQRVRAGETVGPQETRSCTKAGQVIPVSRTTSPVRDGSGQVIGAIVVTRDTAVEQEALLIQERLASIVESSDDVIISKDLQGIIRSWNKGAERIFGYTAEEAIGQPVSMLAVPERVDEGLSIIERIKRGERVDHYETKRRSKDGRVLDISLTVSPLRDTSGAIIGASKVARDITDQKRRAELQERLAAIVESSDDAIISKDLNGIIRSWNRGAERIFGYTAAEAVGKPVAMLAVPERVEEIPNIIDRIRRGEKVDHYETQRRTKDGRVLEISLTVSPIRNASGDIIGASKIARDITERKRLQEERAQTLEREHQARRTAELLNQVGPILAAELDIQALARKVTDLATQLVHARIGALLQNPTSVTGDSPALFALSNLSGEPFSDFPLTRDAAIFAATFEGVATVRSDDITADPRFPGDTAANDTSQEHGPVRSYLAVPVISRTGQVLGGLFFGHQERARFTEQDEKLIAGIAAQAAIALDNARLFSESKLAREALSRSNDELRRANSDLEQFAYSASHDLKEPLRVVAIYSQLVQRKFAATLDPTAKEYLDKVFGAAKRMDKLVQDLLMYTKSSATSEAPEALSVVDSDRVLEQALTNLSESIQESGARIERGAMPKVRILEVHLLQVLQNLVENAIKYRGTERPLIRVETVREDEVFWRFSVYDNGIGIAPEYKEQVFGIFKRLHTAEEYSGTGIGLAICQKLIMRYGGRIWVESEGEGRGSTFRFTVPAAG